MYEQYLYCGHEGCESTDITVTCTDELADVRVALESLGEGVVLNPPNPKQHKYHAKCNTCGHETDFVK